MMKQYVWNKFPKKYLPHQNINVWNILYGPLIYPLQSWWLAKVKSRAKARGAAEIMGNMGKAWENHGKIMENYRRNGKHGKIMEMFISEHHESLIVTVWF